ncbi:MULTISPECIES: type II secretion system major pseudopilin GspG [Inquilinus]|jgi:general secretion pathway protein G|uniref:Type II secretion system core protein G n=1 Tax=Inquilinus ginsengisoli TaxID=363840 RepID=A0ABU1JUG6_9PROT|nr:type II secretion system major pseudopilin GspG [Inquilinus ginsengisoli]MDR6292252.1 general secretion pathway protein G [Inquilinus ginsengisoli]
MQNTPHDTPALPAAAEPDRQAGFTLIELLVVLVILGLLAGLVGPRVLAYLGGARSDSARLQIENFKSALDLYAIDVGGYPTTSQGLKALLVSPGGLRGWNGPYLRTTDLPQDPWGVAYGYRAPGQHGAFDLYSFGADKREGGSGDDADITSW